MTIDPSLYVCRHSMVSLSEADDEPAEARVESGLLLEPARKGLAHRLDDEGPELQQREHHLEILREPAMAAAAGGQESGGSRGGSLIGREAMRRRRESGSIKGDWQGGGRWVD